VVKDDKNKKLWFGDASILTIEVKNDGLFGLCGRIPFDILIKNDSVQDVWVRV